MTLTFENLNRELMRAIPEVQPEYERLRTVFDDGAIDPFSMFQRGLLVYLEMRLRDDHPNTSELARGFDFLERVVDSGDPRVREVARVEVIDPLIASLKTSEFRVAEPLMGPATLELLRDRREFWDRLARNERAGRLDRRIGRWLSSLVSRPERR